MARPRKSSGASDARELLTAAFWDMLGQMPYRKITVKALAARAGLNHNSFYYHFRNMDQLAAYALDATIPKEVEQQVIPRFLSEGVAELPFPIESAEPLFQKAKLFAKGDSPELAPVIRAKVENMWLNAAGVDAASLSAKDRIALPFLSAGGIATMGANPSLTLGEFLELANGTVGSMIRTVVSQLQS